MFYERGQAYSYIGIYSETYPTVIDFVGLNFNINPSFRNRRDKSGPQKRIIEKRQIEKENMLS